MGILLNVALAAGAPLLVSTDTVESLIDSILVDARSSSEFVVDHLPGAISLPADTLSERRGDVEELLQPVEQLTRLVGDAGVDPTEHIVVYSDMADPDKRVKATRLFWVLQYMDFPQLSLLDGDIEKRKSEGRASATEETAAKKVILQGLKVNPDILVADDDVSDMLSENTGTVVDIRPSSFVTGSKIKDYVAHEGHVAGARNLPNDDLFTKPEFVFKSPEELKDLFGQKGVQKDTRLIDYCNSGRSATVG